MLIPCLYDIFRVIFQAVGGRQASMERKLAAILSADVVGYSRLMGADEDATLEALRSHREIIDALIGAHRGVQQCRGQCRRRIPKCR